MRRRDFIVMAGSAKGPNNCGGRGRTRGLADANDPFGANIWLQRNKIDGPHVCRSVGAMNQILLERRRRHRVVVSFAVASCA
jgi:hypothetical protein